MFAVSFLLLFISFLVFKQVLLTKYITEVVVVEKFAKPLCVGFQINYYTLFIPNLDNAKLLYLPFNNFGVTASLLMISLKWYSSDLIGYYYLLTVINNYFLPPGFRISVFILAP